MPNPSEARGSTYEIGSSETQWQSEDRPLADMLLDSRDLPRTLPMELAALVAHLVEVVRARQMLPETPQSIGAPLIIAVPSQHALPVDPGHVLPSERPQ
jgi:hypothetical protein